MEDRQRKNKGEAWIAYTRVVPSALVLLPPPLNRRLGRWLHGDGDSDGPSVKSLS